MRQKTGYIWVNSGQNCLFAPKTFWEKNDWCYFSLHIVPYHATFQKKNPQSKSWKHMLARFQVKLDPNCLFAPKRNLFGKLTNVTFVYLLCPILQQLFYKILRVDHQISKAAWLWAKLGPICPFALKEDFMGKITNVTFVYLLCLIMPLTFKKVLGGNQEISVCTLGPNWPFTQKCKSLEIIDFSLLIVCNHTRRLKKSCEYHEE